MPRIAKELTPLEFRRLQHSGGKHNTTHAVGGVAGLLIQITPNNARTWLLRCQVGNKRREIGLGAYPEVSLVAARDKAREIRQMIREGTDPVEQRKANRAALITAQKRGLLFSSAMEKFLSIKLLEFDNIKHRKQWRATLDRYALPALGNMLVADIKISDIQRVLEPIWLEKNETASRLRSRLEAVLSWATVAGHREGDNPARWKGNLDAVLQAPGKIQNRLHHPALALNEASAWFQEVQARQGNATRALEFLAMTLARSGEIRGATWQEIDVDAKLWTIPAGRMKARSEHRIPLTDDCVDLLNNMDRTVGSDFIFPAQRGGKLSDAALSACMRRIHASNPEMYKDPRSGRPAVPHGLRSTFRDWVAERTEYAGDMAEIALAHKVGSEVERAYRRSDMVEKRRGMMKEWGNFLKSEMKSNAINSEVDK